MTSCECCGASVEDAPLAMCDVLVVKALESMGKWIVRAERSRFRVLGDRPWHVAHTLWQPDDAVVSRALRGAWDVVPIMVTRWGCCDMDPVQVATKLDQYVHDLVITGTEHSLKELRYRLATMEMAGR